jgi:hypothetical protein
MARASAARRRTQRALAGAVAGNDGERRARGRSVVVEADSGHGGIAQDYYCTWLRADFVRWLIQGLFGYLG